MKFYIVELVRYNSYGEILKCLILKCFKNRDSANNYLIDEARRYARFGFVVRIDNDGVYINTVKVLRKNTKVMEEKIYEISAKEMRLSA